jgi:hydrogenase nickel incorporation protein HypA/HybF
MHELSIAGAILGVALDSAGGRAVTRVRVGVGHLRQVVPSALTFSWELVAQGTLAEGSQLELEEIPAAVLCRACGVESPLARFPLACSACGGLDVEVVRGEELEVEWVEVSEADETGVERGAQVEEKLAVC